MPTSMPTIRATTSRALATPWTPASVLASSAALTGASARPKPKPDIASTTEADRWCSESKPQSAINQKPRAASTIPTAVTTPAGARLVSAPPTTAPTGSATRNSTRTRAALSWEPSATVSRAKIGMSTSAAIRAAPTKKLTTTAPQAATCAKAPCGMSGADDRRLWSTNSTAPTAAIASHQGPLRENTCTCGSAVAKARITPASATASRAAPSRSASRTERHQSRRSTRGRRAVSSRASSRSARTIVATPSCDHHTEPPAWKGTNGPPSDTEVTRPRGCRITRTRPVRVRRSRRRPG